MELIEVNDRKSVNTFHELPFRIYRNDPNWIPPLRMMVESIFDKTKNHSLKEGAVCRWVLTERGEPIGRIAAFLVPTYAFSFDQPTGGIGFFECTDNQQAACLLFDTAVRWLKEQGMEAADGPINIGENFFNWGLLVDGFMPQGYGMPYNPPYYRKFFESYGFQTYYKQFSYHLEFGENYLPERFWKIAKRIAGKPEYRFEPFRYAEKERFIADFIRIYNKAWVKHGNYKRIDPDEIDDMLQQSRMMIEEDFIWFAYSRGEPIAIFMMVPDLNQLFCLLKSDKLNFFRLLKLFYLKKRRVINRGRVLVMGVVPRFQKLGIESALFYQQMLVMQKKPWYRELEIGWVGDFNPKMISLFQAVGGKHVKTHLTLRYLFDRQKEFFRAPVIED
ncbi:MAG: GNAT family N-acetyltransferase [Mangrovibacterium sp.]